MASRCYLAATDWTKIAAGATIALAIAAVLAIAATVAAVLRGEACRPLQKS
jgi:hypothetical protein